MYKSAKCDVHKVPQATQSPVTKLFRRQLCNSAETVNLVKVKKKKSPPEPTKSGSQCNNIGMQTSTSRFSKKNTDDTFSFTSCSLKKLLASESPKLMMALIVVAGTLTVILVLKCMCSPAIINDLSPELRERRSNDAADDADRKPWETSKSKLMNDFSEFAGKDSRDSKLQSGETDYDYSSPDLSSILDPIKVNEGYSSNKLRDFYRKLLKTDIQIKNLKKGLFNNKRGYTDLTDSDTPRLKRSLQSGTFKRQSDPSLNKGTQEHQYKHFTLNNDFKNEKKKSEMGNNEHSTEAKGMDEKLEHGYKPEDKEGKVDDLEVLKNKLLEQAHRRVPQWVEKLFGRESINSTPYRRLLQHNDDEDDDEVANEDYEDRTKEPWDREKRTINPLDIFVKTDTTSVANVLNGDIKDLIDAAIRMKTGENKANEEYLSAIARKEYFEDNSNYNEVVPLAQAYSDYGVLDIKKETSDNLAPRNTFKIITTEKPHKNMNWLKIDNPHGERVKLKSSGELKTESPTFFKMLRQKMFPKISNFETNKNNITPTKTLTTLGQKKLNCTHRNETTNKCDCKKHKESNFVYSSYRRSLKSVETDEFAETANDGNKTDELGDYNVPSAILSNEVASENTHEDNNVTNETNLITKIVDHNKNDSGLSESTFKNNNSSATWGLGEIFSMLSDFFMFMAGFDTNQEDSGYRYLYDIIATLNPNYRQSKNKTSEKSINNTKVPEAAMDSKMEKISYKSRVLLSFEEPAVNATSTTFHEKYINESYVVTNKNSNVSSEGNKPNSTKTENKNTIPSVNRTVVKRSADVDGIFWNDMYDEEYGIKEPMEDDMKDKSSVKFNELIGKDSWINLKFKKMAKSFKDRRNRKMDKKKYRKLKNERNKTNSHIIHPKRSVREPEDSGKRVFESLTANVKRVCHEAALAITDTTNREVRTDSDQASTLMQQLVTLMSELVNMQVREKTCVQLPEDLRSFLAWLTSPNTDERADMGLTIDTYDPDSMLNLHSLDNMISLNARSECLGTIHDVEDLILQYDEMSEEDKSKMSGVREYLEHQLHFLHQQLSNFNEYGSAFVYQDQSIRRRRQSRSCFNKKKKLKPFKVLNYYRKKHTKHTVNQDGTENYRNIKQNDRRYENDYTKDNRNEERL